MVDMAERDTSPSRFDSCLSPLFGDTRPNVSHRASDSMRVALWVLAASAAEVTLLGVGVAGNW